jgi:hypothetical protein
VCHKRTSKLDRDLRLSRALEVLMRRLPSSLLIAALLVATSSGGARAEAAATDPPPAQPEAQTLFADATSPEQSDGSGGSAPPAADAQATPEGTVEGTAEEPGKKGDKQDEATTSGAAARLAPGGVLAGAGDAFPLRLTATLDNFAGNGFLAPGYQIQPMFGSSLSMRPSAMLPKAEGLPRTMLMGAIDFSVNNWLFATTNGGVYERQVRVSDFAFGVLLPGFLREEVTGISATPVLSARLPFSITSRQQNLFTSFGAALPISWNSPETPVGVFSVQYTPAVRANLYTQDAPSIPCEAGIAFGSIVTNPMQNGDLPLSYGRAAEILPNGECALVGRQGMASIANNGALAWSLGDHALSLTIGWGIGFLRPLTERPDLSSEFASGQSFTETSNGSFSYTYTVPVDMQLFLTAGIASSQPAFTRDNRLRFPFYDFATPANNFAAAFFDVTVGI